MPRKDRDEKSLRIPLHFDGLNAGESPPGVAVYELDPTGRPLKKLRSVQEGQLEVDPDWVKLGIVGLGPEVEDAGALTAQSVVAYRVDTSLAVWRQEGIALGRNLWERFLFERICLSGEAWKCRPWWWARIERVDVLASLEVSRAITLQPSPDALTVHPIFPLHCVPLCDGIVEVYERVCCCRRWRIIDILERLREILEVIPIPLPDPPPFVPEEPVGPIGPIPPGPDPGPLAARNLGRLAALGQTPRPELQASKALRSAPARVQAAQIRQRLRQTPTLHADLPGERAYLDYVALARMTVAEAQEYVLARPYLIGLVCTCSIRKVGETPLQPGGRFDFCYRRARRFVLAGYHCSTAFAFRVRQKIQGVWQTVYDGLAGHDWFAQGEPANLRTSDWRAQTCGSGPGEPPPSDGALPFVMLEYVGSQGTHHRKFPAQTALSQVGALAADSGTYDTGYANDCPWGSTLGLRLWVSPEMEPIARYYRISVVPVNNAGVPSGAPTILDASVSWSRWIQVGGDWVTTSELLSANPATVGGQTGLIRIPYWSGGNYWLSSQYHQVWNTALFAHGKYLLVVELFDAGANRIKPNGAPAGDPGAARPFQFRRWRISDPTASDNVPFGDLAHVFWIDNAPVEGDIVDFRKDGVPNSEECQFLSGTANTAVSVGFRAYHDRGVANPGNTFMWQYNLTWTRGLNGPSGSFASGTADVGEPPAGAAQSGSLTLGQLLGPWPGFPTPHTRCTFSVHLAVHAKHFTGSGRITAYDYHESASFAASTA